MSDNEIKEQEVKDIQEAAVPDATDISALLAEDPDAADAAAEASAEEKSADNITSEEEKLAPAEEKPAEDMELTYYDEPPYYFDPDISPDLPENDINKEYND